MSVVKTPNWRRLFESGPLFLKGSFTASRIGSFLFLSFTGLLVLFPLLMALLNSFKTTAEMNQAVMALPRTFNFNNYVTAFQSMRFLHSALNTFVITVCSTFGIVLFSSMAGYKLSRTKTVLSNVIFFLIISSMMIPFSVIMIPLVKVSAQLHILNKIWGVILVYIGVGINMPIFLYHGFVKTIPQEVEEAALIDGASYWQSFRKIIFPMLQPINITVALLQIIWIWNDFMLPLVFISNQNNYTLILSTQSFYTLYSTSWELILAGNFMAVIPVIVVYLIFQKNIQEGIATGALKG
ncbi:raffinose/stachyose/melibiose transport system permease protein [Hydrogenispora ethanolica]|uniref:Raffinose/stachyose/melibiose transport system permease protein n=1 Tax=Hydrogenispora ethanolica TaxID=1082276 RepID=A0A4R1RB89_HYDET|nr:carbohydrate ABC transporter permease [Hydrogenispora ethanolica]TCL63044.1 raffinose/stachyose/melibiose transport system permease protein [Hydrogenispora ethanolica]